MIYCGIAIMVYNVVQYVRFARSLRSTGDWERDRQIFNIPVVLLILFLAGYIAVALFGPASVKTSDSRQEPMPRRKRTGPRPCSFPT